MKKIETLFWTLFILFLVPTSCRIEDFQEKLNPKLESIQKAKKFFDNNSSANEKFSKIAEKIDWRNAVVTFGNENEIIEIPFELKSNIKIQTKINESKKLFSNFNRILLKQKNGQWEIYHIVISTQNKGFNNYDSNFNYYQLNQGFDGFISLFNIENNKGISHKYIDNKLVNNQGIGARDPDQDFCVFFGQFNEDGSFTPWYMVYCTGSGSDGTNDGGNYGGGGSGDGTENGNNNTNNENPCENAQEASEKATSDSQSIAYTNSQTTISAMNNGNENGVVFGNVNGVIQATSIQTGSPTSITLINNFANPIGDLHNHLNNNPPSSGDFYGLIGMHNQYGNYNTRYVMTSDGTTYALTVTDPTAMNLFLQNYPSSQIPGFSPNFPDDILQEYNDLTFEMSLASALSYILDKYAAGVSLTKEDSNGNFRKINVTATENSDGTITYNTSLCPN